MIKYDVLDGKVRQTQLFNLKQNPEELLVQHQDETIISKTGNKPKKFQVNLANDPKYSKKRKEMEALLLSEMTRLNDPYRFWDQPQIQE